MKFIYPLFLLFTIQLNAQSKIDTISGYVVIMNGDSTDTWGTCTWHKARKILYTKNKIIQKEITEIAYNSIKQYHYYTDIYDVENAIPIFDIKWKIVPPESILMFVNRFRPYYE